VTDEHAAPAAGTAPQAPAPPAPPAPPSEEWAPPPKPKVSRGWWIATAFLVVVFVGALAGFWIRLPYYTISPGGELPVQPRVKVTGARTYPPHGDVLLLFVRERARVNVWRYVQAKLDSEIDLFKEQQFTGGLSPAEIRVQAESDMANAQLDAKKVALDAVGYKVGTAKRGVFVRQAFPRTPAWSLLRHGDVILSADGKPLVAPDDLGKAVKRHRAGEYVTLVVRRDGRDRTIRVRTKRDPQAGVIIGVEAGPVYQFPIDVSIDTSDIGGPSAGLAMTLAVIDKLTPGNLTGGEEVAVTGTISADGHVGEIGGLAQKVVAVKSAHAKLFIVPKCTDPQGKASCEHDLAIVRKRLGDGTPVVPVSSVGEALRALRKIGGAPVERVAAA